MKTMAYFSNTQAFSDNELAITRNYPLELCATRTNPNFLTCASEIVDAYSMAYHCVSAYPSDASQFPLPNHLSTECSQAAGISGLKDSKFCKRLSKKYFFALRPQSLMLDAFTSLVEYHADAVELSDFCSALLASPETLPPRRFLVLYSGTWLREDFVPTTENLLYKDVHLPPCRAWCDSTNIPFEKRCPCFLYTSKTRFRSLVASLPSDMIFDSLRFIYQTWRGGSAHGLPCSSPIDLSDDELAVLTWYLCVTRFARHTRKNYWKLVAFYRNRANDRSMPKNRRQLAKWKKRYLCACPDCCPNIEKARLLAPHIGFTCPSGCARALQWFGINRRPETQTPYFENTRFLKLSLSLEGTSKLIKNRLNYFGLSADVPDSLVSGKIQIDFVFKLDWVTQFSDFVRGIGFGNNQRVEDVLHFLALTVAGWIATPPRLITMITDLLKLVAHIRPDLHILQTLVKTVSGLFYSATPLANAHVQASAGPLTVTAGATPNVPPQPVPTVPPPRS